MITALNDHEMKPADILNAYVGVASTEQMWTILDSVFSNYTINTAIVIETLYG